MLHDKVQEVETHTHIIGEQLSIIRKDWKIEWQADMESQIATTYKIIKNV